MGMKFDVIVGNPPYLQGLHMRFLKKSFDILKGDGHLLFVQPSDHFLTLRNEKSILVKNLFQFTREIKIVNGNSIFNAAFFVPIMIIYIVNTPRTDLVKIIYPNRTDLFDSPDELSIWGLEDGALNFFFKLSKIEDNLLNHTCWIRGQSTEEIPTDGFVVWFSGIRGHVPTEASKLFCNDFFTIVQKRSQSHIFDSKTFKNEKKGSGYGFFFITREEADNFYSYLKTKFVRQALAFVKNDQNLNLSLIPWFDFSVECDDNLLAKKFSLTSDEESFISKLPNYYD